MTVVHRNNPVTPRPDKRRALPGREAERELFAECLANSIAGDPRLLLFEAERGSGKSSLLLEIAESPLLPRRRIHVSFIELQSDDPLDLVAHAARAVGRRSLYERIVGQHHIFAAARRLFPKWLGAVPGWGNLLEAIARTVAVVRRQRRRSEPKEKVEAEIQEILRFARRRPVALIVDNLELADGAAVDRLRKLMRHADTGTRLLLVGAFRTAAPGAPRPAIRQLSDRLPRDRVVHRRLEPLTPADLDEWLAHRLPGANVPPAFRDWIVAQTGGQPGALEATLAALLERKVIRPGAGDWEIDTPADEMHAAEALGADVDLSRLGEAAAETVRAASVLGDHFDGDELARILTADELLVEDHLAVAARFGLVEVVGTSDRPNGDIATAYRFSSSAARAALLRALPRARRTQLEERRSPLAAKTEMAGP